MRITKVIYRDSTDVNMALAECDVILDDSLRLVGVRLYKNEKGYFLVFPSKQDIYHNVEYVNHNDNMKLPENSIVGKKKNYEEFFHPITSDFYATMLSSVSEGYEIMRSRGLRCFIPK